ncbi:uncharacterized protein LOC112529100 [Cynara cardunculus var. scolymus]|uniref:uncharacterized protein LOC112529100 n=1 Tax=Cynara cardunculus var. scolymus TaxID=59895 RepID=UPI000D6257CC|nr:uncharacterized protein LOC112529100 [Cynara cardunculus var. scolymus]
MSDDGISLSKLDRFFVSSEFLSMWPDANATILAREYSDHCPIVLTCNSADFGPTSFRFFNSWLVHEDIRDLVHTAWNSIKCRSTADVTLAAKLRTVKGAIKKWKVEVLYKEKSSIEEIKKKIDDLETKAESSPLSDAEIEDRKNWKAEAKHLEYANTLDLKQRARVKWVIDGDENSSFFHGVVNANRNRHRINGLIVNGVWETNPKSIQNEAFGFYSNKFCEHMHSRSKFQSSLFKKLSVEDKTFIEAPFSTEEIKRAIWSCGTKLLSMRLRYVVGKVVSPAQLAYIEGRQMLDGPLMLNEVCNWAKRSKNEMFLFKVDFEKAFGTLSWSFIDSMLEQMEFGIKWRTWINGCLASARASVLINGAPTDEFPISRG